MHQTAADELQSRLVSRLVRERGEIVERDGVVGVSQRRPSADGVQTADAARLGCQYHKDCSTRSVDCHH